MSVPFEQKIMSMSADEKKAYLAENKGLRTMVPRIIRTGYATLGLINYFTVGDKEVAAWTIRRGRTSPEAAGVIHTDMEKGFIAAEVYSYDDFVEHGSERAVKEAGKLRLEGRKYVFQDGDIANFKFNAPKGAKKKAK